MNAQARMVHGRAVMPFPLRPGVGHSGLSISPALEPSLAAYKSLLAVADAATARAAEVTNDANLSPQGRKAAMRDWLAGDGAKALRQGADAIESLKGQGTALRAKMTAGAIDKGDVASAMLRGEIRAWLRTLPPAKRTAMLIMPDLDPLVALAIVEAPPQLSDVTPEQRERLQGAAIQALFPKEAEELAETATAAEAVATAARAATKTIQEAAGLGAADIAEAMGGPSLAQRFAELIGDAQAGAG